MYVFMTGTSNPPYSLSSQWAYSFPSKSSYSSILVFPLSDLGLGRDMFWSLGVSCGPLKLVEIELSSDGSLNSIILLRIYVKISFDWVGWSWIDLYQDANSSNTTSLLTCTFLVEGLMHSYTLLFKWVPYEYTVLRLAIKLLPLFVGEYVQMQ